VRSEVYRGNDRDLAGFDETGDERLREDRAVEINDNEPHASALGYASQQGVEKLDREIDFLE
jgi:hypothetical protein